MPTSGVLYAHHHEPHLAFSRRRHRGGTLSTQTGVSRHVGILICCHIFLSSLLIFIVCKYLLDHALFFFFSLLTEYVAVKYDMRFPPLMSPYLLCLLTSFFLLRCLRGSGLQVSERRYLSRGARAALLIGIFALCGFYNMYKTHVQRLCTLCGSIDLSSSLTLKLMLSSEVQIGLIVHKRCHLVSSIVRQSAVMLMHSCLCSVDTAFVCAFLCPTTPVH